MSDEFIMHVPRTNARLRMSPHIDAFGGVHYDWGHPTGVRCLCPQHNVLHRDGKFSNEFGCSCGRLYQLWQVLEMQIAAGAALPERVDGDVAEMRAWVGRYGSQHLKRCVAEGLSFEQYAAVYRDERLVVERPGFHWASEREARELDEPRNPPAEAFVLLDDACAVDPAAKLVYATIEDLDDADDDESFVWRGYRVTAQFLGRTIVWQRSYPERAGG